MREKELVVSKKQIPVVKSKEITKKEKLKEAQVKKATEKEKKQKLIKEVPVKKSTEKEEKGKVIEDKEIKLKAPVKEEKKKEEALENISSQKPKTVKTNCSMNCKSCPYTSSKSREISKHLHKHRDCRLRSGLLNRRNNISLFVCPDCPFKTRQVKEIKKHMKKHSKKVEKSKPEHNVSPPDIKETVITNTEPVAFSFFCDVCKEGFHNLHNLECHRKFSHVMVHKCDECGEEFSLKFALKNHKRNLHAMSSD